MISLGARKRTVRLSLTPMIDVVFLLLVFFMLAARFGTDDALSLTPAGAGGAYQGAPRLITIAPDGLRLNGRDVALETLPQSLSPLMTAPSDTVVLRPVDRVELQILVDVMTRLNREGFTNLVVVE